MNDIGFIENVPAPEIFPLVDRPVTIKPAIGEERPAWFVNVGNTGLFFIVYQSTDGRVEAQQHFEPDGSNQPRPGKETKHSLAYAMGLYAFMGWWQAYPFNTKDGLPQFSILYGTTNTTMHRFRQKLLGSKIYQEIGHNNSHYHYRFDLDLLQHNAVVMQRLAKLAEKCKKQGYKTSEPVI